MLRHWQDMKLLMLKSLVIVVNALLLEIAGLYMVIVSK